MIQSSIYHENIDGKIYESSKCPALRNFHKDAPIVLAEMTPIRTDEVSSKSNLDRQLSGSIAALPDVAAPLNSGGNNGGVRSEPGEHLIAFSSKDHGADAGEISPTLRSMNFDESHINGGGQVAIAFAQNSRDEVRVQGDGNISGALSGEPGMKQTTYLAFHENKSGQLSEADVLGLRSGASHSYQGIGGQFGVRRLTPLECERLQGFPDDWTLYDAEGKVISDSARYRMLGNAVAVPCAEWLGNRITSVWTYLMNAGSRIYNSHNSL